MIYVRRFPRTAIACAVGSIKRNFQEKKSSVLSHWRRKNVCRLYTIPRIKISTSLEMSPFDGFIWVAPGCFNWLGPLYS